MRMHAFQDSLCPAVNLPTILKALLCKSTKKIRVCLLGTQSHLHLSWEQFCHTCCGLETKTRMCGVAGWGNEKDNV